MTLDEAKNLEWRQELYHVTEKNKDGTAQRWRVNSKVKRWKRDPDRFQVSLKHGYIGTEKHHLMTNKDLDLFLLHNPMLPPRINDPI